MVSRGCQVAQVVGERSIPTWARELHPLARLRTTAGPGAGLPVSGQRPACAAMSGWRSAWVASNQREMPWAMMTSRPVASGRRPWLSRGEHKAPNTILTWARELRPPQLDWEQWLDSELGGGGEKTTGGGKKKTGIYRDLKYKVILYDLILYKKGLKTDTISLYSVRVTVFGDSPRTLHTVYRSLTDSSKAGRMYRVLTCLL